MRRWIANLFRRPVAPRPQLEPLSVECRLVMPGQPDRRLVLLTPLPSYVATSEFRMPDGGEPRATFGEPPGLVIHQLRWRLIRAEYEPVPPAAHPEEGA